MILQFSVRIFERTTREEDLALRRLLDRAADPKVRHVVRIVPEDARQDPSSAFRRWLSQQRQDDQEAFEELLDLSTLVDSTQPDESGDRAACWRRTGPLTVTIERREQSDWRRLNLNTNDALALMREPVHLRLENERYDLTFLMCLAGDRSRSDLQALLDEPDRLVLHGGGTGEIMAWLGSYAQQETLTPPQMRRLWRTWVMFDKDAGDRDALVPSPTTEKLIERCETVTSRHGIPVNWVCLQRREIESYLPNQALRRGSPDAANRLIAWRRRTDQQVWAWAYDMKHGLRGDLLPGARCGPTEPPRADQLKAPFDTLGAADRRALAAGFGAGVLTQALTRVPSPTWLEELGPEYDLGPAHQLPRAALLQSIFDRM